MWRLQKDLFYINNLQFCDTILYKYVLYFLLYIYINRG